MKLSIIAGTLVVASSAIADSDGHRHVVPERTDSRAARGQMWVATGGWLVAAPEWADDGGTRVAALVEVPADGTVLQLEARGVARSAVGPWLPMEQTFMGGGHRVAMADLEQAYDGAQIRVAATDDLRIGDLSWELLSPRYPDAGRISRERAQEIGSTYAVASELATIGVVDRAGWGARPTGCTATEDNWYRMAVHHTAGLQTSGGSVQGALRATQAYTMDSGGYCDIPYQFLVGFDGTLYEGRSLALRSGATGGGNNDGNIAVCFLGCYHPNGCPGGAGDAVTEEMMQRGQLLIQTLSRLHDVPTGVDDIRGHGDWPGNATACPGQYVHGRLGELRDDLAWFAAAELSRTFPGANEPALDVLVDTPVELSIELQNVGGLAWEPGRTFLGTAAPRDAESPLYDPSWPSASRVATVDAVVEPGGVGTFSFRVLASEAGDAEQILGLVHEGTTWFADAPWGGGPGDDAIAIRVRAAGDGDGDGDEPDPDDPPSDEPTDDVVESDDVAGGCSIGPGSSSPGVVALVLLSLVGLVSSRRSRRQR